ncbi:MAG: hypothetical protein IPP15_14710 [Saprospiraceae bacterium]|uniref:HYR-like domain-containing protein n=1 Tax=Candidatus Opimibacter skivensis TaxID=2982028 RepID=A0A9D7XUD3_9BACT|nr:hypothetical protein [Candidatus Opimibacter skivensis]
MLCEHYSSGSPPVVTDNCGVTLTPTGPVESGSVTCEGDITYTWTYTDCEGNTQDYVHKVTIEYEPFAAIPPTTAVVDCYANIILPVPPTVLDNCNVSLTPTGPVETGSIACEGDITYTWTYTDCEGNTQDYVHTVTVEYQPFVAIPPTTAVVDCYANIILPSPPVVTDNCGVTLSPTGPVETGSVTCEGDITYTWTYTDCEGNTQGYVHTVTVEYQPFAAIPPTNAVVDCYANIVLPTPPTITDNCGVVLIPTGPIESGAVTCAGNVTYTWMYTDCEGNTQNYTHTVTVSYQPLGAVLATTAVVDCYTNIVLPIPPIVTDNCGVTLIPTGPVETGSVLCEGNITYTWTFIDCDGNTQDYVHTVTIEYEPFLAISPTTGVVDCYANIVLPTPPTITDNCGVTLTPTSPVETGSVLCEGDITYIWTYTDCEGNTQDYVHTVTIEYQPFASIPPTNAVVDCYANIILPTPPTVTDNCGATLTPIGPVETGAVTCEGDIIYTWTYTDCEGNTQDYVHTVTIEYEPFPAIPPTTAVVDCYANIVLTTPPTITDNCGVTLSPTGPIESGSVTCEGDVTYTWTYTDCEGNTQDYVHTITIEYQPFSSIPPTNAVVDCYSNIILPTPPTVTDNCGATLTPIGPVETGAVTCEGDITYTWTYSDCEGNTQDYVHTVTIEYEPFAAIPPTAAVVDCYANIILPVPPTVTDNCGVTLTQTGPVETGSVLCEGDVTYTWTYTDCEGNTQDYVHAVTIEYEPFPAIPPTNACC